MRLLEWPSSSDRSDTNLNNLSILDNDFCPHFCILITAVDMNRFMLICKKEYNKTEVFVKFRHSLLGFLGDDLHNFAFGGNVKSAGCCKGILFIQHLAEFPQNLAYLDPPHEIRLNRLAYFTD